MVALLSTFPSHQNLVDFVRPFLGIRYRAILPNYASIGPSLAYGWGMSKESPLTDLHYDRLDRAMDERRLALGMRWRDLADRTGLSGQALRDIRRGRSVPRDLTARNLEDALSWNHGSIQRVLRGDEPEVAAAAPASGAADGLAWWVEGDATCYELTRTIGGNPFSARLVVRDGRSRDQVEKELRKVVELARIQLEN